MPTPAESSGSEVTLLPIDAGAAAAVLAGDWPAAWAHLRPAPGWPHEDTRHALAFLRAGGLTWAVVCAGRVVGELGTKTPPDDTGTVEIGYGLAAGSRGRGIGTAAVAALLDLLAARPDVHTVVAHVHHANTPSRRLLERLGFAPDGEVGDEVRFRRTPG